MALDETISNDDVTENADGLAFVYRKHLLPYLEGVKIDYTKSWFGWRLVILSPFAGNC